MVKIIADKENFLLNRKEMRFVAESDKTPSLQEAMVIVSSNTKASPDVIAIKLVKGKFGRNTFLIEANVYKNKEDRDKFEPKKKEKKQPVA